ncbi:MAG TPA: transcriptional regulator, partial [Flavobacteriales bacterium]|nr:transcriptional regulator [Flavobacteriales bacterium]
LLHNQLRLAVVSLLVNVESADFTWLLEKTGATRGNLSVQLSKLKDAGYIKVKKTFKGSYPNTSCSLTAKGLKAFEGYVEAIKGYLEQ